MTCNFYIFPRAKHDFQQSFKVKFVSTALKVAMEKVLDTLLFPLDDITDIFDEIKR
jgi:hypothetical protein